MKHTRTYSVICLDGIKKKKNLKRQLYNSVNVRCPQFPYI